MIPAETSRRQILCLGVFLSISVAIGAWHWRGPTVERPLPDMVHYLAMADSVALAEIPAPFRYRPWTPWLAARIPAPPQSWLDAARPLDDQRAHFRFAVVNVLGLFFAAAGLARLASRLLESTWGGWAAGAILLTSYFPLTVATLPMVEAWSYAFLAWGLVFLLERRHGALAVTFLIGLTCKETVLLLLPAAALLGPREARRAQALAMLPAIALYTAWRGVWLPSDTPLVSADSTRVWLHDLFVTRDRLPGNAARTFLAFHLWWIPAIAAWWSRRAQASPLIRWGWLVPPILLLPFVIPLVPGRVWFFAFPFVIPLAVAGLRDALARRG